MKLFFLEHQLLLQTYNAMSELMTRIRNCDDKMKKPEAPEKFVNGWEDVQQFHRLAYGHSGVFLNKPGSSYKERMERVESFVKQMPTVGREGIDEIIQKHRKVKTHEEREMTFCGNTCKYHRSL